MTTPKISATAALALALALAPTAVEAAAIRYMGSGDYLVSSNWQGGVIPGAGDQARINWGDNTVTLSGAAPDVLNLQTGVDEPGTLVIESGGSLTSTDWSMIGTNGAVTGRLVVNSGGIMTMNNHFWSGVGSSTGITDINGGTVSVGGIIGLGTVDAVNPSGGTGTVNINDGGLLMLSNIHAAGTSVQPGSLIDINGTGRMTLPGDFTGVINNYITNEQIAGNGLFGFEYVEATFDAGENLTTVRAIPEPSGAALLGLGGAMALFARRRRNDR